MFVAQKVSDTLSHVPRSQDSLRRTSLWAAAALCNAGLLIMHYQTTLAVRGGGAGFSNRPELTFSSIVIPPQRRQLCPIGCCSTQDGNEWTALIAYDHRIRLQAATVVVVVVVGAIGVRNQLLSSDFRNENSSHSILLVTHTSPHYPIPPSPCNDRCCWKRSTPSSWWWRCKPKSDIISHKAANKSFMIA